MDRALGVCKQRDFEYAQHNPSIMARGGVSHVDDEVRALTHTRDAEHVGSSSGHTTAIDRGNSLPTHAHEPIDASDVAHVWMLYQIVDIGVGTHITVVVCLPIETASIVCERIAERMDYMLVFGDIALCDYNNTVSFGHGHAPGHSHIHDIDTTFIGEPIFNSCKSSSTLIDSACVWSQMEALSMDHVPLNGHLHMRIICETCRRPRPAITPLIKFKPIAMAKHIDEIAARPVFAQKGMVGHIANEKEGRST